MRLSTSTNIMDRYNKKQGIVSMEDCLKECASAGYRVMDMNCHDMSNKGMPLACDDWEKWVDSIAQLASDLGIEFSQSHSHFYHFCNPNIDEREWHEEMVRRSVIASGKFGVKWMTMHASSYRIHGYDVNESKRQNIEYFKPYIEMAQKHNVGVAIENLFDPTPLLRTYSAAADELIELVDSFNDDSSVGVCWDIGHGNLVGVDQNISLKRVGKRLKSIHVADNHGVWDEHLLPYYGDIKWDTILKTLKEIDYQYDFTYEITPFLDKVPPEIRSTALRHTVEVGHYLIGLAK